MLLIVVFHQYHSDWIKTRDYASWVTLYDHIPSEVLRYPFHLLKRAIYQEPAPDNEPHELPDSKISDIGSPLTRYDDDDDDDEDEALDLPPALSIGPNWNRNVPLPESTLRVINTSFDFEKPCNIKVIFHREDAAARFQITEKYRGLAADAEVPSSFKELEIKVCLLIIVQLFILVS